MQDARFFQTTRGRIVSALRRLRGATAVDLAREFGLSTNAVRQQLVVLERDGFVAERSVRRGPTKPTLEYSLTPAARELFPQQYDRMLNAVLREVRATSGDDGVAAIFRGLGERNAARIAERVTATAPLDRAREVAAVLRDHGVEADVVATATGFELREHACPYAKTVLEHPEICSLIHSVLREAVAEPHQIESIATGGEVCRFEFTSEVGAAS